MTSLFKEYYNKRERGYSNRRERLNELNFTEPKVGGYLNAGVSYWKGIGGHWAGRGRPMCLGHLCLLIVPYRH